MSPVLTGRVSRREIALSPHVWFAVGAAFALIALACFVMWLAVPPFTRPRTGILAAVLAVTAVVLALRPPPEPGSATTHVVIGLTYVGTSGAMFLLAPQSVAALPSAIFIGPLAAIWVDNPRHVAAHYLAATVALLAPSAVGGADLNTLVATATILIPILVLGLCCRAVLGIAEAQGHRLEAIAMRDPLTGVGNRRLLDDRLQVELARHAATRRALTVFALDLDGFKAINDQLGHGVGDELLVVVGQTLTDAAGPHATVVRQGGDEFCVVMPDTTSAEAAAIGEQLRSALRPVVSAGVGYACFPSEARTTDALLELADARLVAAKERRPDRGTPIDVDEVRTAIRQRLPVEHTFGNVAVDPDVPTISRAQLGASVQLWRTTGAMFLFYALVGAITLVVVPQVSGPWFPPLVATGAVVGVAILLTRPPGVATSASHLVVALSYVYPAPAMATCRPGGAVAIGAAVFAGALIPTRTATRRQAALHTGAATALFGGLAISGTIDTATVLALLILIASTIVLCACCVIVFEAAEAQGVELERLAVIDPLTGLANRRHLHAALSEHLAADAPVSVLALDLNGFKALNDAAGHGAGDELLIDVADRLRAVTDASALVARPGGDEFTVVLPSFGPIEAGQVASRIRKAVATLSRCGHPISTGIGQATYPADARTLETLLDAADRRLLVDKYDEPLPA